MALIPVVLMAVALAMLFSGVVLLRMQRPALEDEAWRDRPPVLFRLLRPVINLFSHRVADGMRTYSVDLIRDRLYAAGVGYAIRAEEFVVCRRMGLAMGLILCAYAYLVVDFRSLWWIGFLLLMIPAGYFYPDIWLRDATKRRQNRIEREFPFCLDLLVLSMRAGLNFSSAIDHVMEKMPPGPLKQEFGRFLRDTRTGVNRRDALIGLGRRVRLGSIGNFVAAVNQAEESGGELGDILLQQSQQRRKERFLRAETLANRAPVKLLFPLVFLLFPMTFIIIGVPVVTKLVHNGSLEFLMQWFSK